MQYPLSIKKKTITAINMYILHTSEGLQKVTEMIFSYPSYLKGCLKDGVKDSDQTTLPSC